MVVRAYKYKICLYTRARDSIWSTLPVHCRCVSHYVHADLRWRLHKDYIHRKDILLTCLNAYSLRSLKIDESNKRIKKITLCLFPKILLLRRRLRLKQK